MYFITNKEADAMRALISQKRRAMRRRYGKSFQLSNDGRVVFNRPAVSRNIQVLVKLESKLNGQYEIKYK